MTNSKKTKFTRRAILGGALAGTAGLVLAMQLPRKGIVELITNKSEDIFSPNAFVRIAPDNTVTVLVKHLEMGQGANTGLPILIAEEMDADWSQMRAETAPVNNDLYANGAFHMQGVGGSSGLRTSFMQMREAGATARAMLVAAAASEWKVNAADILVEDGVVSHAGSEKSASFGELAQAASQQSMPEKVSLKDRTDFKLVGKENLPRLDTQQKTTGQAEFGIDVYLDGMQTVTMIHPPKFGAKVASFDATAALAVTGVRAVHEVPTGIAVYADNTYAAMIGRGKVSVEWDETAAETRSTDEIIEDFRVAANKPAIVAEEEGNVAKALKNADRVIEAEYIFPYLAHAPMEPLNGVIDTRGESPKVWSGFQMPFIDQNSMGKILDTKPTSIDIKTLYAGGSFGRRGSPNSHFAKELAEVAKAAGPGAYKLLWTRENDIKGGYYRPLTVHKLKASLDKNGTITGWSDTIANQSIMTGTVFDRIVVNGLDRSSYEGAVDLSYDLPNRQVSWAQMESSIPVLWWRSVPHTHTGYAVETFLDKLLVEAGKDPVQGRMDLIREDRPRDRAVLERVAEMAQWSGAGTGDKGYGVAVIRSFGTYVAQIAEVKNRDGVPHVSRVWCAVDCGLAVTPDIVRAQIEGGIGYGMGAALFDEITLAKGGEVEQENFDTYRMLRFPEMPQIEVSIMGSPEKPTGIGEPGTPPIAPAVGNAWRALAGEMKYRLPFIARA